MPVSSVLSSVKDHYVICTECSQGKPLCGEDVEERAKMTPSMIVWTLDLLDWVREQLGELWPEARLRGGETDIDPEPYRIRLRDAGKQYWLFFSPDAIRGASVGFSILSRSISAH